MQLGARGTASAVAAVAAGLVVAGAVASAASPQTVTLGSTSGTPNGNLCAGSYRCTFVPFNNVSTPELQVPFDGTVTSFSVNTGSTGTVELRVLRPAGGGKFTGVGTSLPETDTGGVRTFTVALPVKAGDVLGLDNASNTLMFDTTSTTPIAAYYFGGLADGSTAAPSNNQTGYRLLLSATVQASPTGTTGTTGPTGNTGPPPTPPRIIGVRQSHPVWREGNKLAAFSRRAHKPRSPVGTTFSFSLNEQAFVSMAFIQHLTGRVVHGRCVTPTTANRSRLACPRLKLRGALRFNSHAGPNALQFQGRISRFRKLPVGAYTVQISATNSAAQASNHPTLAFKIVR